MDKKQIIDSISKMNLVELKDFISDLCEVLGISQDQLTAAPVASGNNSSAQEAEEESSRKYNLTLTSFDSANKVKCVIFLKNTFSLDLAKCNDIIASLAKGSVVIRENINKDDEAIKKIITDGAAVGLVFSIA